MPYRLATPQRAAILPIRRPSPYIGMPERPQRRHDRRPRGSVRKGSDLHLVVARGRGYKTPASGRSVAQPGSALASGARGRRFKSCHSDQHLADFETSTAAASATRIDLLALTKRSRQGAAVSDYRPCGRLPKLGVRSLAAIDPMGAFPSHGKVHSFNPRPAHR